MKIRKNILIVILILIICIIIFLFRGSYASSNNSYDFTRAKMQDMVVSTALGYYYNQKYSDYEQYSMDKANGVRYTYNNQNPNGGYWPNDWNKETNDKNYYPSTFYWRNFNNPPEEVSRSNRYNIDCSGFVSMVYLHSIGYDMSDYRSWWQWYVIYDNGEWKNSSDSIENYQNMYLKYGQGQHTEYMANIAKTAFMKINNISNLESGYEYQNTSNNYKDIVYYYQITGNETDSVKQNIKDNIRGMLEKGDLLIYRSGENGHVMLYIGSEIANGEDGFIHSTGVDFNPDNNVIGEDSHSVRYDTWESKVDSNLFKSGATSITIIRPINSYCSLNDCHIDTSNIKSNMHKNIEQFNTLIDKSTARDTFSRLGIEQYQRRASDSSYGDVLNKYNSINPGAQVAYTVALSNKSTFNYCSLGAYLTENDCINNNGEWKSTDDADIIYDNLTLTSYVPDGTTFLRCDNNCTINGNIITWSNISVGKGESKAFTYVVKDNDGDDIINDGTTIIKGNDELKLGSITTHVNPTIITNEEKDKIKEIVDGEYNSNPSSSLDFIKDVYNKAYDIDFDNQFTYDGIKNLVFNADNGLFTVFSGNTVNEYNVYFKNTGDNIINRMLVPGMYGGRMLKGDITGDRARFINTLSFEFGDVIVTYDFLNNSQQAYMFYGFDNSRAILVYYDNGILKTQNYDGWRTIKSIYANSLFAVLRPSRVYFPEIDFVNGDVNNDGKLDQNDIIILAKYIINKTSDYDINQLLKGDINNDGVIKMNDIMQLIILMS